MSLKLLQPGIQPLGQFDGLDSDVLTMKGGEVVSFCSVTTSGQPGVTNAVWIKLLMTFLMDMSTNRNFKASSCYQTVGWFSSNAAGTIPIDAC